MIGATIGSTIWRISGSGLIRYYTPVTVERLTAKQIVVKTPKGNIFRHWRKNGYEVGFYHATLSANEPVAGPHMRLSDQAKGGS